MIRKLCFALLAAVLFTAPSTANAFWPYGGWGFGGMGYGNGWGWGWGASSNYVPAPPYFAVHPPVYYSPHITARHYGASPFAWPAGMSPITYTPDVNYTSPEPEIIENPFVKGAGAKATAVETGVIEPVNVSNPFVVSR